MVIFIRTFYRPEHSLLLKKKIWSLFHRAEDLQIACFVKETVQNQKAFDLQWYESQKLAHLRGWTWMFDSLYKLLKHLID